MTIFGAFFGGFHSFFSIWVFCLMQIVPFIIAFIVASTIREGNPAPEKTDWHPLAISAASVLGGFIIMFTAIGMVTTPLSKILFRYMDLLNQFGGVIIGLIALYFIGLLTLEKLSESKMKGLMAGFGVLLGASLGVAYKPCVTPTLTVIYNINTSPDNVIWGGFLIVVYTLGISAAILLVAVPLAIFASKAKSANARLYLKRGCGVLLMAVALLMLTDKMTIYKSFLVEGFVPAGEMEHMDHSEHGDMDHSHHEQMDKMDHSQQDQMDHSQHEMMDHEKN